MRYYKRFDASGRMIAIGTGPVGVEITEAEYNSLLAEAREKAAYIDKLYAGEITIDDVPEVWREDVQRGADAIKAAEEESAQNISSDEFMSMIEGVL